MIARLSAGVRARLLILGATLLAYASSLTGPFQFDDHGVIRRYTPVHSLDGALDALFSGLRPLLKLSYALSYAMGGGSPLAFHVFNVLVHAVNVALFLRVYGAASDGRRRWPFHDGSPGAFVAAIAFALHPIHTEAVTYISGRSSSLATTFTLLALLCHAEGVRARRPVFSALLAPLAFLFAVAVKETAATLPLALLLWDVLIERAPAREVARRQAGWWLLGLALFAGAVMHQGYFSLLYQVIGARPFLDSLAHQLDGLGYLAARLTLLRPLCIDPGLWVEAPSRLSVALGAAISIAVLGLATWQARRRPLLAFGVGWFFLQSFVPYVLLPRTDVINERHAYLADVGLFIAVGSSWGELVARRTERWLRAAPWLLAATLGVLTARRNQDYRSEIALWKSTVETAPHNPRAHNNLGVAYESAGRYVEARIAYARALKLEPRYDAARNNLRRVSQRRSSPFPR